jgi:CheY-like chemotaxis protein
MTQILIADDDEAYRRVLRTVLMRQGYEVREARDGHEVLTQMSQQAPDLLVTDILMPGKDGLETMVALRKQWPDTRIIAISGGGRMQAEGFLQIALRLGARETLTKPFSNSELIESVQRVLGK